MKIDLLNINQFIKDNNLQEITNPVYFNMGNIPTEDGLFSYNIFGKPGSEERKNVFGYVNLRKKFLHPAIFILFKKLGKNFENLILSKSFFSLSPNGELVEDQENGKTGIKFLYDNFEKITYKETGTSSRAKKLSLLNNLKKSEIFIDNFLIIPCYYRDFNPSSSGGKDSAKVDEINKLYSKLIMLTKSISPSDDDFNFMGLTTESSIQLLLNDIYKTLTSSLAKKNGLFHQGILGKTVDYCTRSVISAQRFKSNTYKEIKVPFGYTGVPVTQLVVLFYPFYVKFIQDFMEQHEFESRIINIKKNQVVPKDKLNLRELFDEELIKKLLDLFIKAEEERFQVLYIEDQYNNLYKLEIMKEQLGRDFTLMDLIYLASVDICENKHVYVTRYPVETFQNIYPSKISILTTTRTVEMTINDKYLPNYPYIVPDYPVKSSELIGTTVLNGTYLDALGGDYDGDTVSLRAVYSVEANQEADRLIKAKTNILNQNGKNSRTLGNEAIQSLYTLTRM